MKTNLLSWGLSISSKQTFIVFLCFISSPLFAQNPLQLGLSMDNQRVSQVVSTKTGYVFYNTVNNSNPSPDAWGLWRTNGTPAGTKKLILDNGMFAVTKASMLTPLGNDKILFAGDNEKSNGSIWVSDGTGEGTFRLNTFTTSSSAGAIQGIASINNTGICALVSNDNHLRIVTTQGIYGDVAVIQDFGVVQNTRVVSMININNIVYLIIYNGDSDFNDVLWRTDGTIAGTFQLKDLGTTISPLDFIGAGGTVYFMMWSRTIDGDATILFKSDGTAAGTIPVKEFNLGLGNNINPSPYFTSIGNTVYFAAYDNSHGKELWKSDGTETGTTMVADINPGVAGSNAGGIVAVHDVLYFNADDGAHGPELWKYDVNGTVPQLVKDIYPGSTGSGAFNITALNNTIVFSAGTPGTYDTDEELWVSDGTAANTVQISHFDQLNQYVYSPQPHLFAVQDGHVFFAAKIDLNGDGINREEILFNYTPPDKIWTGSVSANSQDGNNWFPAGVPAQTDNVLLPVNAANPFSNPYLLCNDFINNGSTVNVGNGLILLNGNFFNSGTVNNPSSDGTYYPGAFALVSSGVSSHRTFGNTGIFNGQLTLSGNINLHLTTSSYMEALRIEGTDSVFLGPYQLTVNKFPISLPVVVLDSSSVYSMEVGSNPVTFPIMSYGSYTPVTITNHGTPGYFNVSMKNDVFTNGTSGNAITGEAVNKTWLIEPVIPGNASADITLQWNATDELSGFDRSHIYLMHYNSGAWDFGPLSTASGNGPFLVTRTGITSFSPFGISSSSSALPVNLISFTANKSANAVQLNWQTNSEKNFSFFSVERSKDGVIFSKLDKVSASFSNSLTKDYSYTDDSPLTGTNFYRLKMIDVDGKFTYSKIVAVRFEGNNSLQIFPNPAKYILHVQLIGSNENALLQIIDITGRKVKEQIIIGGTTSTSVDINDLPKGMYHLIFKTNSKREHQKFVKQ